MKGLSVLFHILVIVYICSAYYIICEKYFIYALRAVCAKLGLPEDVAGATFLAAGSSSPELFSNIMDTFIFENNIGLGTIVGSTVFNILFGLGICALVAPLHHKIHWQAVLRDMFYFLISIIVMLFALNDGYLEWYESLVFVLVYVLYCVNLAYNKEVMAFVLGRLPKRYQSQMLQEDSPSSSAGIALETLHTGEDDTIAAAADNAGKDEVSADDIAVHVLNADANEVKITALQDVKVQTLTAKEETQAPLTEGTSDAETVEGKEQSFFSKFFHYWAFPLELLFRWTLPSCETDATQHKWWLTFIVSILYFIVFSWLMVLSGSMLGCILDIPAVIMGATILAIGTSIPDALGGIAAAKRGLVGMSISNALGSNIFDVCFALGLPALIFSATELVPVVLDATDLIGIVLSMLVSVLVLLGALMLNKWKLTKVTGYVFLTGYGIYIIILLIQN
jgi:K+-dependent Na+/Ca+ exchanger-like protein